MANLVLQWRAWVLLILFFGPILAYMGFGTIWLWETWLARDCHRDLDRRRRPLLAARGDLDQERRADHAAARLGLSRHLLPRDREAWKIVEAEADSGESLPMESLILGDLYIDTGRRLLKNLAEYYHPHTTNPLDEVPLIELLTAMELAAEDLAQLSARCRAAT